MPLTPRRFVQFIAFALLLATLAFFTVVAQAAPALKPFASQAEMDAWLAPWLEAAQRQRREQSLAKSFDQSAGNVSSVPAPAPAAVANADRAAPAGAAAESVTNVQTAGVDEGGIVKLHGKHLVVLRRGRLFTVDIDGRRLEPLAAVPAFGGRVDAGAAWYDEMLIWRDTVVVIGYSYGRGGTEIGLFDLSPDGGIRYRATYHLRSNDYYSSRNYASRLVGSKLVFYTPLNLDRYRPMAQQGPAFRHWMNDNRNDFKPIAPVQRIYRGLDTVDPNEAMAMHSVTTCDLARAELDCESTAVLARPGRVFYVAGDAVYVWTVGRRTFDTGRVQRAAPAAVYRLPLTGEAPSLLNTTGTPVDQFSFLEADGQLNVLLRAAAGGESMWGSEAPGGDLALLRVPVASFGDINATAPRRAYRSLPSGADNAPMQNRFVGDWLLYGTAAPGPQRQAGRGGFAVQALRYASMDDDVQQIRLDHGVDRIEALGRDAVVIGSDSGNRARTSYDDVNNSALGFTSLRLGREASVGGHYERRGAAQGESRSHGFFYKAEGANDGMIGLPIVSAGDGGARRFNRPSASMLFVRNRGLDFSELGALDATPQSQMPRDACLASCVDWYGNARPLFVGGRVFALLGYEIVEGRIEGGRSDNARIVEQRRIDFTPRAGMERLQ